MKKSENHAFIERPRTAEWNEINGKRVTSWIILIFYSKYTFFTFKLLLLNYSLYCMIRLCVFLILTLILDIFHLIHCRSVCVGLHGWTLDYLGSVSMFLHLRLLCLLLVMSRKPEDLVQFFSLWDLLFDDVAAKLEMHCVIFVPWSLRACDHYLISIMLLQSDRSRFVVGNNL